jgi:putative membrane protein
MKKTENSTTAPAASAITGRTTVANRVRNLALATILAAGIVGAPYVTANAVGAADQDAKAKGTTSANAIKNKASSESMFKDETVYVFKNNDGSTKNITVSDWLKNGDKDKALSDVSNLKNITNTEGDQAYTSGNKNRLTWDAEGSDIYYQGSSDAEPPVDVKVTYKLNGKKVTPDQISGKSGKVKIRYDYTNKSKVKENGYTVYTPFVAMTAVILDNDNFKNVKVTNAKMVNDGDRTTVVGYALPGLAKSLDVSSKKVDIPDYVEVTADATDFSLSTSATYVSSNLFDDVDTGDTDLSKIGDRLNQMQDAMEKLMDGSNELQDGLSQLADGGDTLASGLKQAQSGTKQLSDGNGQVLSGLYQLKNGTKTSTGLKDATSSIGTTKDNAKDGTLLGGTNAIGSGLNTLDSSLNSSLKTASKGAGQIATGAGSAKKGSKQLSKGSKQLENGLSKLKAQFDQGVGAPNDPKTLLGGSTALAAGIGQLGEVLIPSLQKITTGADQVVSGAKQVKSGANQFVDGTKAVTDGTDQLVAGTGQLQTGAAGMQQELASLKSSVDTGTDTLIAGADQISSGLSDLQKQADSGLDTLQSQLSTAANGLTSISGGITKASGTASSALSDAETQAAQLSKAGGSTTTTTTKSTGNSQQADSDAAALTASIDSNENLTEAEKKQLKSQVTTLQNDSKTSTATSSKTTGSTADTSQLIKDIKTAEGALSKIDGLTPQIDKIAGGLKTASNTVDTQKKQLDAGIDRLETGAKKLSAGLEELQSEVDDGIGSSNDSYSAGKSTLLGIANDMTTDLASSSQTMQNASKKLAAGLTALQSGSKTLGTGADTLSEGAEKLSSSSDAGTLTKSLQEGVTGSQQLAAGLKQLKREVDAGLGDEKTSGTLINGAAQIQTGSSTLDSGLGQLQSGAKQLSDGLSASLKKNSTLNKGMNALKSGVKQVSNGLYVLKYGGKAPDGRSSAGLNGAVAALGDAHAKNTLIYGANAVDNGLTSLLKASGQAADGAQTLATNLHKAENGSEELSDGLKKFDDQAVKKLLDVYNDDLAGLTDRVDAVVQAGKDYQTFSGKSGQMKGQVKFIYEMDGINDDDDNGASDDNSDDSNSSDQSSSSTEATNDSENNN